MANLLEKYAGRIAKAETIAAAAGNTMDNTKKIVLAQSLHNINSFLNEAFDNSIGTDRSSMGLYKKFCVNLTNLVLPTLIGPELVMTVPMQSASGYVSYLRYTVGSSKGDASNGVPDNFSRYDVAAEQADTLADPWTNGIQGRKRVEYTSAKVTKTGVEVAGTSTVVELKWTPVIPGSLLITNNTGTAWIVDETTAAAAGVSGAVATGHALYTSDKAPEVEEVVTKGGCVKRSISFPIDATVSKIGDNLIKYGTTRDDKYNSANTPGSVTGLSADTYNISYEYNNEYVPANDVPLLNAEMDAISLTAKPRRIAILYSQLAAFQAKTDYGFDMGAELAAHAAHELSYEIDGEIVQGLDDAAGNAVVTWDATLPTGLSTEQHFESFNRAVSILEQVVYDRTQKFYPTFMVVSSSLMQILPFCKGFRAQSRDRVSGPFFAGDLNGLKIYVSPILAPGRFFLGVKGNDLYTAAAVFAPYMLAAPTQLLGYADGAMSQGFSTMYDFKILNKDLLVAGQVANISTLTSIGATGAAPFFNSVV